MSAAEELRGLLRMRGLRWLTLAMLLAGTAWRSFQLKYCVLDLAPAGVRFHRAV